MITFYGIKDQEWDEEKFNQSLLLANQDKPTTGLAEKVEWMRAIRYVARAYWSHFKDEKKTFHYFKRLYDQGAFIDDYVYYGLCYFYGYGVEEDNPKAADIIKKAYHALSDSREKAWAWQMYQMVWYYTQYYEIKKELTQTKETLEARLEKTKNGWNEYIEKYHSKCKEYSTLEAQLSQTKKEWTDKYNQLVNEYNTLLNKSKASYYALAAENEALRKNASSSSGVKDEVVSKYNQLVAKYNEICDAYEKLDAKNTALSEALASQQSTSSSRASQSDMVKVKICYGYVDDSGYKSSNWVKRIEMPMAEYKALLNGSMKAREAYVKSKWLSSYQRAVDVSISLDN